MLRRLLPAVALLATLLIAAPTAQAARNFEIGLQDDATFVNHERSADAGYQYAKELRVSWIRVQVSWARVLGAQAKRKTRPANLKYDWTPYNVMVAEARRNGFQVQVVLNGQAPAFATTNKKVGPRLSKRSAAEFARFAAAGAANFYKRGVRRFSIWNEPNFLGWIAPLRSQATLYRGLYLKGYPAIRRKAPRAQILMGETAPLVDRKRFTAPITFLRKVLCVDARFKRRSRKGGCRAVKADGYATHPYSYSHKPTYRGKSREDVTIGSLPNLVRALDKLKRLGALKRPRGGNMPIYLTEFGYLVKRSRYERAWKESDRKRFIPQAYSIALKNKRVRQLLHYELFQPKNPEFQTHLVKANGARLPSFFALKSWANRHRGSLAR